MSCSYADLALASYNSKALAFDLSPTTWKRFLDDVFLVYLNNIDKTGKIQFTMQNPGDDGLEFVDLKLKIVYDKISVLMFFQNRLTASPMLYHLPAILTAMPLSTFLMFQKST